MMTLRQKLAANPDSLTPREIGLLHDEVSDVHAVMGEGLDKRIKALADHIQRLREKEDDLLADREWLEGAWKNWEYEDIHNAGLLSDKNYDFLNVFFTHFSD